jgi:hypothetical protein
MASALTAARVWLGSMFVYTAGLKLANLEREGTGVMEYQILPRRVARVVGFALPFGELLAGGLLLVGRIYPTGPLLAASLGSGFGYGAYTALRGESDAPCGCTGRREDRVTRVTLMRAIVIASCSISLLVAGKRSFPRLSGRLAAPVLLLALVPGARSAQERLRLQLQINEESARRNQRITELTRVLAVPPPAPGVDDAVTASTIG